MFPYFTFQGIAKVFGTVQLSYQITNICFSLVKHLLQIKLEDAIERFNDYIKNLRDIRHKI